MTTNSYFNLLAQYAPNNEVNLVKGFVQESIQMYGFDMYYIKRSTVKFDRFFGEDILSNFTENFLLECYLESFSGFDGVGDMITNFGSVVQDQCSIHLSRQRFELVTSMSYPLEGDLIFFPQMFNKGIWEIKFVEDEQQFYPMGQKISFKLKLALFDLGGESFTTGITDLDKRMNDLAPINTNTLSDLEYVLQVDNQAIQTESDAIVDNGGEVDRDTIWGQF